MNKSKTIYITLIFIMLAPIFSYGQTLNKIILDEMRNREVLIDYVDREGIQNSEMGTYYNDDYAAYKPNDSVISQLIGKYEGLQITIVLGSWCGDSKDQLPRFLKVLDLTAFDQNQLTMIGVDSHKKAREVDISVFNIEKVPTFIFFRNEKEIGRIIETPILSLEEDFLNILNQH